MSPTNYTVGVRRLSISILHDFYHFPSLNGKKMPSIHTRSSTEKPSTSFCLLKHRARIWRRTINSKHGAHLVPKTTINLLLHLKHFQRLSYNIFSHISNKTFSWNQKRQVYLSVQFLQTKEKNVWLRCLYCLWSRVTIT